MLRSRTRSPSHMKFCEISARQRLGLVALSVVQLMLLIVAEVDIQRRPTDEVLGGKLWWRIVCLINFVAPLAYFRRGRKRPALDTPAPAPPGRTANRTVVTGA